MSSIFDGVIHYSYPSIKFGELDDVHEFGVAANTLFPDEFDNAYLEDLGVPRAAINSGRLLRTTLVGAFNGNDEKRASTAEGIARALGTLVGSFAGSDVFPSTPPYKISREVLDINSYMIDAGNLSTILDHGIGAYGMASHYTHIKTPGHKVLGSTSSELQAFGLEGMAKKLGYPEKSAMAFPGADETSEIVLETLGAKSVDLITFVQTHNVDPKVLGRAIDLVPELLRVGGLVVLKGPQNQGKGMTVNHQAALISDIPGMEEVIALDIPRAQMHNAFIARKVA